MAKVKSKNLKPPASLKDIAQELGVSYSLVSKVLSGRMSTTGVRNDLREAIILKAKDLNYRPNPLATALKRGRKGAVGALIHPLGEQGTELTSDFIKGLSLGLDAHGLRLWLRFFETDEEFSRQFDQRLRNELDGLIVAGIPHPSTYSQLLALHDDGLPIVTAIEGQEIPGIPNVTKDNVEVGRLATRHLFSSGRRHLAHFKTGPERYEGFCSAHADAGIPLDSRLVVDCQYSFSYQSGLTATASLLDSGVDFDGIVAQSDHQAIAAVHELMRRGKRVPQDVAVTGVDDSPIGQTCVVPITSVSAEMETIGRKTADLLMLRLEGKPAESLSLTPRLAPRASS